MKFKGSLGLIAVKEELAKRGVKAENIKQEFVDVTEIFKTDKKQSNSQSSR